MDPLITVAARALAAGDPLGALKRVALRDDASALALRGIAMAQLGDFVRAKALLRRAARAFGPKEMVVRARCVVAEAEVALARALGEAWPGDVPRDALVARAFGGRHADESHRARLRVEVGRLRRVFRALADVSATKRGFALAPRRAREVVVLARPLEVDEAHAAVLTFLADGESWSSSALALALGTSQRTVQRALESLVAAGKVQSFGRGRARRWMTPPVPGFTTTLLLPAPLPGD
jgi:hypothetical protein